MYYARRTGAAVLLMVMVAIGSLLFASSAYADGANGPWIADSTKVHLVKYSYQQVLANCFGQGAVSGVIFTESEINNPTNWFSASKTTAASYILEPVDGIWSCNSEVSTQTGAILNTFGWTGNLTGLSAACDLGAIRVSDQGGNPVGWLDSLSQPKSCTDHFADGSWGFRIFPTPNGFTKLPMGSAEVAGDPYKTRTTPTALNMVDSAKVKTIIAQKSGLTHIGNDDRYVLDWAAFSGACQPSNGTPMSNGTFSTPLDPNNVHLTNGSTTINAMVVNQDGTISYIIYDYVNNPNIYAFPIEQNENSDISGSARKFASCQDLVKDMNSVAVTYGYLVVKQKGQPGSSTVAFQSPNAAAATSSKLTCSNQVPGAGWFVCPIITGLATLNDGMWGLVKGMLNVNPIESTGALHDAWVGIKNLANIAFVIVFLIIIFSQLTSAGVANYGVKKMLPRLIIGAILVNVSFLIIQILVDISNIAGSSLHDFIISLAPVTMPTWSGLIGAIAATAATAVVSAAGVAIVGGAAAAFWILLPMAGIAALGLLAAVLTLVFRQALIPVLAILAPLAFVALLLPNTESWFKKWRGMLVSLLMLYPIAAFVFGGAQLAASVIINGNTAWWSTLIGLLVMSLPLFSLPFLAKQGGPLLTKVGGSLSGLANKLGKPLAGSTKSQQDREKNKYLAASGSRNPFKKMALSSNRNNKLNQLKTSAYQAQQTAGFNTNLKDNAEKYAGKMPEGSVAESYIKGAAARAEAEELKSEMTPLASEIAERRATDPTFELDGFLKKRALTGQTEMQRVAAMHHAAALGRDNIMRDLVKSTDPDVKRHAQEAISANVGALISKAPDLVKPANIAFNTVTGNDMAQFSTYTMGAYMEHLNGLQKAAAAPGATAKDAENLTTATNSFNSAVEDITKSPELQARFSSGSGVAITKAITAIGGTFSAFAAGSLTGLKNIKSDGKIRP